MIIILLLVMLPLLVMFGTYHACHRRTLEYKKRWQKATDVLRYAENAAFLESGSIDIDRAQPVWTLREATLPNISGSEGNRKGGATFIHAVNRLTHKQLTLASFWCEPNWRRKEDQALSTAQVTLKYRREALKAIAEMNAQDHELGVS